MRGMRWDRITRGDDGLNRPRGVVEHLLLVIIIAIPCVLPVIVVNAYLQGACAFPSWFVFVLSWSCFTMGYVYASALYSVRVLEVE